jgi:hypothetical protein
MGEAEMSAERYRELIERLARMGEMVEAMLIEQAAPPSRPRRTGWRGWLAALLPLIMGGLSR